MFHRMVSRGAHNRGGEATSDGQDADAHPHPYLRTPMCLLLFRLG